MSRKSSRQPLEQKFLTALVEGKTVIAGVSGGPDSMALLNRLCELEIPVIAAHMNHCLRGAESDRDENFVREFCRERGIPFYVKRAEIAELARRDGLGEEECGRRERYAFFEELRREIAPGAVIATAHTLSDQLETLLFRLVRGTGPAGLCGIPPERDGIVRPLLSCSREEIEDYCHRKEISFVTDSTNSQPQYARNRIRLEVVPALKELNSAAEIHAGQLAASLASDRDYLEQQAGALLEQAEISGGLSAECIRSAHPSIGVRATAMFLERHRISSDHPLLLEVLMLAEKPSGTVNLPGGKLLTLRRGILQIEEPAGKTEPFCVQVTLPENPQDGEILAEISLPNGKTGIFMEKNRENFLKNKKIYNSDLIFSLDYDTIVGRIELRSRQAADVIRLPNRPGSRLLKKLYSECGLSRQQRQNAAVAADERGLVWAEHIGPAEHCRPGIHTERLLLFLEKIEKGSD